MYHLFGTFFVRTSYFPFNSLDEEPFETKIQNQEVQEAIYIASPVLYTELQKYAAGTITNAEEKQRIESSVYRYISRMASRCTPFGLFAGCSIGEITGDKTNIVLSNYNRTTRLDMYFLCALSQELSKLPEIKGKVKYYPNTTLYPMGNKYRYVEYQYKNSGRIHQISSVERSVYLDTILKTARKGVKINELLNYLVENEIEQEEALAFIGDLIDSQIIVSELSPSVTGDDYFDQLIHILEDLKINEVLLSSLKEIQNLLHQLDSDPKDHVELYQRIIQKIKAIKIPYEEKFLFQVDMTRNVVEATLGQDIVDELQSTMAFLNKITNTSRNENLTQFQQAFYNRYEDREVPLMEALDPETGIGYPVNQGSGNLSPLLENFNIPAGQANQGTGSQSNDFISGLFKKATEVSNNEIILDDNDVKNFKTNWDDLPPTIQTKFEILKSVSDTPVIYLTGFSGSCGANMFARFAHTDRKNILWLLIGIYMHILLTSHLFMILTLMKK